MPNAHPRGLFRLELKPLPERALPGMRCPTAADQTRLASLMYHAYLGTIDYEGEDEAQALEEVRGAFDGRYGAFMQSASRVVEREGILVAAALLTRWQDRPFVAFIMTRPEYKRQGLARACLESAMTQLLLDGEHELRLISTLANAQAMGLYRKLGFRTEA